MQFGPANLAGLGKDRSQMIIQIWNACEIGPQFRPTNPVRWRFCFK